MDIYKDLYFTTRNSGFFVTIIFLIMVYAVLFRVCFEWIFNNHGRCYGIPTAIFYLLIEMMALGMWLLILPAVVVLSIYLIEWCFCKQD
ncbi:hypothetical protein BGI37_02615 [Snodgrassella alvi]|jgi:hypothetical protein|nr:hypothetical protein BGI37_02615 [Snodgrassella alvi]